MRNDHYSVRDDDVHLLQFLVRHQYLHLLPKVTCWVRPTRVRIRIIQVYQALTSLIPFRNSHSQVLPSRFLSAYDLCPEHGQIQREQKPLGYAEHLDLVRRSILARGELGIGEGGSVARKGREDVGQSRSADRPERTLRA
jgi:hypothetical protein